MSYIDDKFVKEEFNRRAEFFQDSNAVLDATDKSESVLFSNYYRDYITKLGVLKTLKLKKTDHVLDYGCGVGRLTKLLADKVDSIVGVDISDKMIEVAQRVNPGKNITYAAIQGNHLQNITSKPFDVIFSYWVFQHISINNIHHLVKELHSILKENGNIYIYEQIVGNNKYADNILEMRDVEDYTSIFTSNGFELVSVESTFRMPSYGLSLFRKIGLKNKLMVWLCGILEMMTVNRKPEHIEYYTACMVFRKK